MIFVAWRHFHDTRDICVLFRTCWARVAPPAATSLWAHQELPCCTASVLALLLRGMPGGPAVTDIWIVFAIITAIVVLFAWDQPAGHRGLHWCSSGALGHRNSDAATKPCWLWRPRGHLHRGPLRRLGGAGGGGRHRLGRAVADPAGGRKPDAADRADDGFRRRFGSPDQRERRRRRADPGGRRHGDPAGPGALADAHAAGVWRTCRITTAADRQPGQRAGGRGVRECGRCRLWLFRIRAGGYSHRHRLHRHRGAVRRAAAADTAPARRCRPI